MTVLVTCRKHCHLQIRCKVSFSHNFFLGGVKIFIAATVPRPLIQWLQAASGARLRPHSRTTQQCRTQSCPRLWPAMPSVLFPHHHPLPSLRASALVRNPHTHTLEACSGPPNPNKSSLALSLDGILRTVSTFSFSRIPTAWQRTGCSARSQNKLILQAVS